MPARRGRNLQGRKGQPLDTEQKGLTAYRAALDRKAIDLAVLDLRGISSITDLFLICSGQNLRQMEAIAESIDERLSALGIEPISREGLKEGSWILLDYDDIVIHVFSSEARTFYHLERLWARAPRLDELAGHIITDGPAHDGGQPIALQTGNSS